MTVTSPFELISPTAKCVSWLLSRSNTPHAAEIARRISAREGALALVGSEENLALMTRTFAAWAELRFYSLSRVIEGVSNILELAAGFSPRGLIFTDAYPSVCYVSTDLENVHAARLEVFKKVDKSQNRRNLWYRIVDITNRSEVVSNARFFKGLGEIAVINEGLFGYFTHAQKLQAAKNICELLRITGGVWYTSDIHTVPEAELIETLSAAYLPDLEKKVGRSFKDNAFVNLDEAGNLMAEAGLRVSRHRQLDMVAARGTGLAGSR